MRRWIHPGYMPTWWYLLSLTLLVLMVQGGIVLLTSVLVRGDHWLRAVNRAVLYFLEP
jgi:hypothetical protein